jgi:hypothetical protein
VTRTPYDDLIAFLRSERVQPILWQLAVEELERNGRIMPDLWFVLTAAQWKETIDKAVVLGLIQMTPGGKIFVQPEEKAPVVTQPSLFALGDGND